MTQTQILYDIAKANHHLERALAHLRKVSDHEGFDDLTTEQKKTVLSVLVNTHGFSCNIDEEVCLLRNRNQLPYEEKGLENV